MTIPEFISHLDTQPWTANYVSNFFTYVTKHKRYSSYEFYNFINDAFNWKATPEDHQFWEDIYRSLDYSCDSYLSQIKSALHSRYFSTHPEFFI